MSCYYFRAQLSCQPTETQRDPSIYLIRLILIEGQTNTCFWDVLFPSRGPFYPGTEKIGTMHMSIYKWLWWQLYRAYLNLSNHAGRQRCATDRSYCRSINQWFCSHGHQVQHNISYDVQWRLPVLLSHWTPVQFGWPRAHHGWLLQNIRFYKQHDHTSLKGHLK